MSTQKPTLGKMPEAAIGADSMTASDSAGVAPVEGGREKVAGGFPTSQDLSEEGTRSDHD